MQENCPRTQTNYEPCGFTEKPSKLTGKRPRKTKRSQNPFSRREFCKKKSRILPRKKLKKQVAVHTITLPFSSLAHVLPSASYMGFLINNLIESSIIILPLSTVILQGHNYIKGCVQLSLPSFEFIQPTALIIEINLTKSHNSFIHCTKANGVYSLSGALMQ